MRVWCWSVRSWAGVGERVRVAAVRALRGSRLGLGRWRTSTTLPTECDLLAIGDRWHVCVCDAKHYLSSDVCPTHEHEQPFKNFVLVTRRRAFRPASLQPTNTYSPCLRGNSHFTFPYFSKVLQQGR
eukprot:scaffold9047_cov33-Tisochrysis_lutea.AAC.3